LLTLHSETPLFGFFGFSAEITPSMIWAECGTYQGFSTIGSSFRYANGRFFWR
jgi:hypothetical protein